MIIIVFGRTIPLSKHTKKRSNNLVKAIVNVSVNRCGRYVKIRHSISQFTHIAVAVFLDIELAK